jgi:hypothetical protein
MTFCLVTFLDTVFCVVTFLDTIFCIVTFFVVIFSNNNSKKTILQIPFQLFALFCHNNNDDEAEKSLEEETDRMLKIASTPDKQLNHSDEKGK